VSRPTCWCWLNATTSLHTDKGRILVWATGPCLLRHALLESRLGMTSSVHLLVGPTSVSILPLEHPHASWSRRNHLLGHLHRQPMLHHSQRGPDLVERLPLLCVLLAADRLPIA
jgi:hypothetical protein